MIGLHLYILFCFVWLRILPGCWSQHQQSWTRCSILIQWPDTLPDFHEVNLDNVVEKWIHVRYCWPTLSITLLQWGRNGYLIPVLNIWGRYHYIFTAILAVTTEPGCYQPRKAPRDLEGHFSGFQTVGTCIVDWNQRQYHHLMPLQYVLQGIILYFLS